MSKTVAERLTELRDKMGYTQKEIAITLKVSGPTVSQWESGIKVPKNKNLERLADLYGVSTDYLMGRTEETNLVPPFDSGTALHTARLANNMTPQDIAIIANVGPATVKAWEANRPKAPRDKLALIAGALNMPLEELAGPGSLTRARARYISR